jgi:hypothetical protein
MPHDPGVDSWFAALDHPLRPLMERIRATLTSADDRLTEQVQYGTVQFGYQGTLCGFVQVHDRKRVSLMFNAAGRLTGEYPHLEGKSVKYLRFASDAHLDERGEELRAIVRDWIEVMDQRAGSARR